MKLFGKVKFFSDDKGYGFIRPDTGGDEVFMHRSDFVGSLQTLLCDQRVSYELAPSKKGDGKKAVKVDLA